MGKTEITCTGCGRTLDAAGLVHGASFRCAKCKLVRTMSPELYDHEYKPSGFMTSVALPCLVQGSLMAGVMGWIGSETGQEQDTITFASATAFILGAICLSVPLLVKRRMKDSGVLFGLTFMNWGALGLSLYKLFPDFWTVQESGNIRSLTLGMFFGLVGLMIFIYSALNFKRTQEL